MLTLEIQGHIYYYAQTSFLMMKHHYRSRKLEAWSTSFIFLMRIHKICPTYNNDRNPYSWDLRFQRICPTYIIMTKEWIFPGFKADDFSYFQSRYDIINSFAIIYLATHQFNKHKVEYNVLLLSEKMIPCHFSMSVSYNDWKGYFITWKKNR